MRQVSCRDVNPGSAAEQVIYGSRAWRADRPDGLVAEGAAKL